MPRAGSFIVPLDVLDRHDVNREDIFAGVSQRRRCGRRSAKCAACAPASRGGAGGIQSQHRRQFCRHCCPSRLIGPTLRRMERPGYDPFQPEPLAAMAAAMAAVARGARSGAHFRALIIRPPPERALVRRSSARDRRARGRSAPLLRARFLAEPRPNLRPSLSKVTVSASGGNRPKFTFIGWNDDGPASMVSIWPPVMCASSAPCAVRRRRRHERLAAALGGGKARRQQADGGGFHIALAAGDLAGKAPARIGLQPQRLVEQLRRIEKGVAMQAAEPGEFGVLQAREWCGRCAPARRVSAWSGSRPC